jgi:hypothetical protein
MRKIANDDDIAKDKDDPEPVEKKPRKKWTLEETQMLVDGCNIVRCPLFFFPINFLAHFFSLKWGVGNWKAILKDPNLKFDNRSPVDLKDR